MKTIVTILGARPQFIKHGAVYKHLRKRFKEVILHTGQHYDNNMSGNFFKELSIPKPDINLNIGSGSHGEQTGKMLIKIEVELQRVRPSAVIVYGDTNSTLAAAIACSKLGIPLLHIESGLRSFNKSMPEEINRICADHLSELLFCPTKTAVENLKNEGINKNVFNTGDVMYDLLKKYEGKIVSDGINDFPIKDKRNYIFLTLHRQESMSSKGRVKWIFNFLESLSPVEIVFPIHPGTKNKLKNYNVRLPKNIIQTEPVNYLQSLSLQKYSRLVITDSGGLQKEAYILKKPCLTLREETEWVETVNNGWNIIAGYNENYIKKSYKELMKIKEGKKQPSVFGKGKASERIVELIHKHIK